MKSYADYLKTDWTEHFVELSTGIRMAYTTCGMGDGEPIVLIHGVTDGRVSWSQAAPMLADMGFRVYVPEYRGNGKTDKPEAGPEGYTIEMHVKDMVAFFEAEGIEKAHIVGHSLGSIICQRMNIEYPELVKSTTLIASTVKCMPNEVLTWIVEGDGADFRGVLGYDEEQVLPESFLKEWTENTNECDDFQQATYAHACQIPYKAWHHLMNGLNAFDNREDIGKVSGKVLVIWGTDDTVFPIADQEELKAGLTGCDVTYKNVEGGSHNTHWDSVATCRSMMDMIHEFISEI